MATQKKRRICSFQPWPANERIIDTAALSGVRLTDLVNKCLQKYGLRQASDEAKRIRRKINQKLEAAR